MSLTTFLHSHDDLLFTEDNKIRMEMSDLYKSNLDTCYLQVITVNLRK